MIKITIGQALLIILNAYQKKLNGLRAQLQLTTQFPADLIVNLKQLEKQISQLKTLYLAGVKQETDLDIVNKLIEQEIDSGLLKSYEISREFADINDDPARRYFETHLAYETLATSLDKIHIKDLTNYFKVLHDELTPLDTAKRHDNILNGKVSAIEKADLEYSDAIKKIESLHYYKGFTTEQRQKLSLFIRCSSYRITKNY